MKILALLFVLTFLVADVAGVPLEEEAYPVKWSPRGEENSYAAPPPDTGSPFESEAYPVKWSPRGEEDSYAAPPPLAGSPFDEEAYPVKWSPRGEEASYAAPPPSAGEALVHKHHLMVKNGVLFLQRNLFDGAVLPANTELGHATRTGSPGVVSTTDPTPPQFGFANLQHILAFFNITQSSEHARQVASTLLFCRGIDAAQQEDEPQACATTQRAAMEFAATALGTTPRAERTVVHGRGVPLRYVVAPNGITRIGGGKVVPCHPLPYPAHVLYCHRPAGVQAFRVELVGQDDASLGASAIAVCHEQTDGWDQEYFAMLNGTRGEPICHYMTDKYVLWVAAGEI